MAPIHSARGVGVERVRARILDLLHFGKLEPGDRAPSLRRLADQTGVNRKTVHRAYCQLAAEGFLDLRRGSGTFVAEGTPPPGQPSSNRLLSAVHRMREEAESLGLSPGVYAEFARGCFAANLGALPLAVVECNREQVELIEQDLSERLCATTRPVLLADLQGTAGRALQGTRGIVTTDCHRLDVLAVAGPLGVPVYPVALDPSFPQVLAAYARQGPVVMVVRDRDFAPAFLRLLRRLSVPAGVVRQIHIVEPREARETLLRLGDASVYVSPTVKKEVGWQVPDRLRSLDLRWHVLPASLERVRTMVALDLAMRDRPASILPLTRKD